MQRAENNDRILSFQGYGKSCILKPQYVKKGQEWWPSRAGRGHKLCETRFPSGFLVILPVNLYLNSLREFCKTGCVSPSVIRTRINLLLLMTQFYDHELGMTLQDPTTTRKNWLLMPNDPRPGVTVFTDALQGPMLITQYIPKQLSVSTQLSQWGLGILSCSNPPEKVSKASLGLRWLGMGGTFSGDIPGLRDLSSFLKRPDLNFEQFQQWSKAQISPGLALPKLRKAGFAFSMLEGRAPSCSPRPRSWSPKSSACRPPATQSCTSQAPLGDAKLVPATRELSCPGPTRYPPVSCSHILSLHCVGISWFWDPKIRKSLHWVRKL